MNDQTDRKQALDTSQSFLIQAPAGSGKTELLTQRYLKLLSMSDSPERIVAMTFTNKTVNELTKRVIESLKLAQKERPHEAHKQITYDLASKVLVQSEAHNWELLTTPERFKIITIDGLSSLINKHHLHQHEWTSKQIISEKWAQDNIYLEAAKQTLLSTPDTQYQQSIESVLLYLDNDVNKFCRLIVSMLGRRDQWLTELYADGILDVQALKQIAQQIINQHLEQLKQQVTSIFDEVFFDAIIFSDKSEIKQINSLPNTDVNSLTAWNTLRNLCLTNSGKRRKILTKKHGFPPNLKQQKQTLIKKIETLSSDQTLRELLDNVNCLPDVNFSIAQVQTLKDISQVLKIAVAQLMVLFETEQAHDFIQVALDADQALKNTNITDIALFLDYQVQHILIDEFQDISVAQLLLIEKLVMNWQIDDAKTLCLVGDPMQSIYLFRKAQVGLFLKVSDYGIANVKLIPLELKTNFRSTKSVVQSNNDIFSIIFPEQNDAYKGSVRYSKSTPHIDTNNANPIRFYPFAYKDDESEAQKVLEIIQNNPDKEIAVLVRSRKHLAYIVPCLKAANIKFESFKTTPLKDDLFCRSLLSLTRALMHLGDKLAWLSLLRSPWCGLILKDLLILSKDDNRIIWEIMQDEKILQQLSQDGEKRTHHITQALTIVIQNQSKFDFAQTFEFALYQLMSKKSFSITQTMIKEQFLQVIHRCESTQMLDIHTINQMLEDLYAPSSSALVKLMTIHQAKGLEFDVVIIPGLGKKSKNNESPIIHLQKFFDKLLLAPIKSYLQPEDSKTYRYLQYINNQQNKYEMMRLLYVAMTRAKYEIHLLATLNKENEAIKNTFLALLSPIFESQFNQVKTKIYEPPIKQAPPLVRYAKLPTYKTKLSSSTEQVILQDSIKTQFKSLLGTLIHQYYEHTTFSPDKKHIKLRLIEAGFGTTSINKNIDFIEKILNNTRQDKHFTWLFKQRKSTQVEAEFRGDNFSIIIDRLFIDDGTLWIIDFKTALKQQGESDKQFIQRQKQKHNEQLLHYKQVVSKSYSNPIKCALYCPYEQQLIKI